MIKYFKELENPNDYYLDLINTYLHGKSYIDIENLPLEFFEKYNFIFKKIYSYNLINENDNKVKKLYIDDIKHQAFNEDCIDGFNENNNTTPLSKNGLEKLNQLKTDYINNHKDSDIADVRNFERYYMAILDYLYYSDMGLTCSKDAVFTYIYTSKIMAKFQKKLTVEDEKMFDEVLNYIGNYEVKIPCKDFEPVKMHLPNSWYITPYNHLYNTMGEKGHKQANLIYPFYYSILKDKISNPVEILKSAKDILERGWINKIEFEKYTNLIYDFMTIYPDFYYTLNSFDKHQYGTMFRRTYNPKIVKLIAGIESAQAGLYSFFYYLKNNSSDYYKDLEYLKNLYLDDILVRCCGFHKVSSILGKTIPTLDKTITTSCINYEEQFDEYIKKGWHIDFVKPIILSDSKKRIEEYPDDFLLIRKMYNK